MMKTRKGFKEGTGGSGVSGCNPKTCQERVEMMESLLSRKEDESQVEGKILAEANNVEYTPTELNNDPKQDEGDSEDDPRDSDYSQMMKHDESSEAQSDSTKHGVSCKPPKRQALSARNYSCSLLPACPHPASSRYSASITGGMSTYIPRRGKKKSPKAHGVVETLRHLGWFCLCNLKKAFKTQARLSDHIRYFNKDPKFQCPECPYRFVTLKYLRKHMYESHKLHLSRDSIGCSDCGAIFADKEAHKTHRLKFHARRTEAHFRSHARDDTCEDPLVFRCQCGRQFSRKRYLASHIQTFMNPAVFECDDCSSTFRTLQLLHQHLRKVHKFEVKKQFGCGTCGQAFDTWKLKQKHQKDEHGTPAWHQVEDTPKKHGAARPTDRWNFQCLCRRGFTSKTQLMNHIRNKEPRIPFKCTHCGIEFQTHSRLKSHIRKTHNLPDYDGFGCIKCGTSFPSRVELRSHQDTTHGRGEAKK